MTTINLTALAEVRAKMTPELSVDVWQNTNEGGWAAVGPHHKHDGAWDEPGDLAHIQAMADAAGIVATHNAADVLIEVARTAIAANAALVAFEQWKPDPNRLVDDEFVQLLKAARSARDVFHSAIAEVRL